MADSDEGGKRGFWGRLGRAAPARAEPRDEAPPAFQALFGSADAARLPVEKPAPSAPAAPTAAPAAPAPPRFEATEFLTPRDLAATPAAPARILAIGSCFLREIFGPHRAAEASLRADFLLVNLVSQFPEAPPAEITEYDCQVLQIPLRAVMSDQIFAHLDYADEAKYQAVFEQCRANLQQHVSRRMKWNVEHGTLTFVMNVMQPQFSAVGRLARRFDLRNPEYFVARLNQELEQLVFAYRNSYILDVDRIAASLGRRHVQDDSITGTNHNALAMPHLRLLNRMEITGPLGSYYDLAPGEGFRDALIAELHAMLRTARQTDSVKLIVTDLDDTLWVGVSGDTADIGPHMVEGWPIGYIEALHYLRKRGVLLAIASKNDDARIRSIWWDIFGGRLKLEDFAAIRINWQPKSQNMQEILQAMNLLPRNVVFIDDNPSERAQMQAAFPDMRILGGNPFLTRRILLLAPETQVATITAESANRTTMIQSQLQRETERATISPEEFARQQQVKVRVAQIDAAAHTGFPRALELINKTNQFNTTGKRWTAPECETLFAAGGMFVAYHVEDRYTPYGLVGVAILRGGEILQWVMSCRVIGLGAEQAVMHAVIVALRQAGVGEVTATLIKNAVNQPCQGLFASAGFTGEGDIWRLAASVTPLMPPFVELHSELKIERRDIASVALG